MVTSRTFDILSYGKQLVPNQMILRVEKQDVGLNLLLDGGVFLPIALGCRKITPPRPARFGKNLQFLNVHSEARAALLLYQ